jgi:hypothetical protein
MPHNRQVCGVMLSTNPDIFHPVGIDNNKFKFMPGPEINYIYYRGQNQFFEPSYPSIYRHDNENTVLNEIKKIEFKLLLQTHPIIKELENIKIQNSYFETDYEGLAQHYGFKTNHMDITNDINIAMFFASTDYDGKNYKIFTKDREVVIYEIQSLSDEFVDRLNIIGAQAISRPAEQKAFSIEMNKNENFNDLEFVKFKKFTCSVAMSKKYYDMFEGGKLLFPKDIISDKAKQIQNSTKISQKALQKYFQEYHISKKEQMNIIKSFKRKKMAVYFNKKDLKEIKNQWNNNRDNFLKKISGPRYSYLV